MATGDANKLHLLCSSPASHCSPYFQPPSPAAGYPVTLNTTSSGGTAPYTFAWTFGDGINGTGNPAIHTFASGGSSNAAVALWDSTGATIRTYTITNVTYRAPPIPQFTRTA